MKNNEINYGRIEKVKSLLLGAIYSLGCHTVSRPKRLASTWGDLHLLTDKNYINAMPEEHLKDSLIELNKLFLEGMVDAKAKYMKKYEIEYPTEQHPIELFHHTRVEKIINLIFDLHDKLSVRLWELDVKYKRK